MGGGGVKWLPFIKSPKNFDFFFYVKREKRPDHNFEPIENLSIGLIKQLCTDSVYRKAKIFKVQTSKLISTNVERSANCIEGEFRAALIYEQSIRWGGSDAEAPFALSTISVFCSCKYFNKETVQHGFCCKHIIGQLRRVLHNSI